MQLRPRITSLLLATSVGVTSHAVGDTVRLKSAVRLPVAADVIHLADVATLEGNEAVRLGDVVVGELDPRGGPLEISVEQIRRRLDAAGVHWGRVNLNGRQVVVRPRRGLAAAPAAMSPANILAGDRADGNGDRRSEPVPADRVAEEPTLRGTIAREMIRGLAVEPRDLRLVFDAADRELLASSRRSYRFELAPQSSFASELIKFNVRLWAGGEVVSAASVAVRPQIRVDTAVLQKDVDRREPLAASDFVVEPGWFPPPQAQLVCEAAEVAGRVAVKRLAAGDVVRVRQVRHPTIVTRGQRVMVRCVVGGVVISLAAEARADAAVGDRIEFRRPGERKTFLATVTAAGEAVVDLSRLR